MMIKMAAQMIGAYDIVNTTGFPFAYLGESPYVNPEYLVPVTLADNVKELHSFLFGEEDYSPSETVYDYSYVMEENSGYTSEYRQQALDNAYIPPAGSEADAVK